MQSGRGRTVGIASALAVAAFLFGPSRPAFALTCDELKAEIARLRQTLANEQRALANCNNSPGSCTPGQVSGIQQAIQIAQQEIAADEAQLPTACNPPPPPNFDHVSLQGIEVAQAVQDFTNSVPLIAGKTTWVRVYLDKVNGTRGLTATLNAQRGAAKVVINPQAPITVDAADTLTIRRQNWGKSLNFPVPASMIASGTTIFTLGAPTDTSAQHKTIICDNCTNPTQVSFSSMPPLVIRMIGLTYPFTPTPGGSTATATPRAVDYTLLRSWLGRAYPVSQVNASQTTAVLNFKLTFGNDTTDCTAANAQLSAIRAVDMAQPGADNRTHYIGLVSNQGGYMRGCAAVPAAADPTTTASGPSGAPGGPGLVPSNSAGDPDASFADWYGGHELGHTFGRNHPNICGTPPAYDTAFPYPNGQISNATEQSAVGLDVGDATNGAPFALLWGATSFDIMTYCRQPDWPSDYTYRAFRQRLLDENPGFLPLMRPPRPLVFVRLSGALVHIVGSVNLTRHSGSIDYVIPVATSIPTTGQSGRVELVVRDAAGRALSRTAAPIKLMADPAPNEDERALIDAAVPFADDMARIELVLDGAVVAQYSNAQTAPPAVTGFKTHQARGETGPTIDWNAMPAAAGTVTFTVQANDGNQWQTVAVGLAQPGITLSSEQLTAQQLRITAINGFRSSPPVVINMCAAQIKHGADLESQAEDFAEALASGEIPPPPRTPQKIQAARAQLATLRRSAAAAWGQVAICQAPRQP